MYASKNCHLETVDLLIRHGGTSFDSITRLIISHLTFIVNLVHVAKVNETFDGWTSIMCAADKGHTAVVSLLLANGAQVTEPDYKDNKTPLLCAAEKRHLDVMKILVKERPALDLNHSDKGGWTALMRSAHIGYTEAVQFLLDSGANINKRDVNGSIALHFAAIEGHTETVRLLIERGSDVQILGWNESALFNAICKGHVDTSLLLIQSGSDLDKECNQYTPLIQAIITDNVDIATALLENGADPNKMVTQKGKNNSLPPLFLAIKAGSLVMVDLLLKY